MESVQLGKGRTSENPNVNNSNLPVHNHVQHHPRPAPDLLRPASLLHEHPPLPLLPHPLASLQSIPSLSSPLLSTFSMISAAAPRRAQATQHLRSFTLLVVAGAAVCDIRGVGDAHGGGPAGVLLQAAAAGGGDAGVVDGDYLLLLLVWVFSELGAGFACG
ncbi:hypothetical protein SASPL_156022 [Salvia splendens]|uniref:Uncharacterized protein n=1 Tax=Salvia splendens TaxID=180675 RepID=A0A8X8YXR1_SALSN|nr:hypothetical protein SASPL_156022 [Salvia splendens]